MKVEFDKSFGKSIDKLKNKQIKSRVKEFIIKVEEANQLTDLPQIKKLKGFDSYYRAKIGMYRVGFELVENTVRFIIIEHRKDIYRKFP